MCPWRSRTTPLPSPSEGTSINKNRSPWKPLRGDIHHAAVDLLIDPDIDPLLGREFGGLHGIRGSGDCRGRHGEDWPGDRADGNRSRGFLGRRDGFHAGAAIGPRPAIRPGFQRSDSIRQFVSQRCSMCFGTTPILPVSDGPGEIQPATGQGPERLPNITPPALQTEKFQQKELFARLKQVEPISLALSERNRRCESVIIA